MLRRSTLDVDKTFSITIIGKASPLNLDILHIPDRGRQSPSLQLLSKKRTITKKIIVTNHGMVNVILPPTIVYGNINVAFFNDIKEKYSFAIEEVKVPSFDFLRRGLRPIAVVEIASREYIVLSDEREKLYFMRVDSKSPRTIPERVIKEAYKILNERGELDFDLLKDRTGKYTEAALAILALAKLHEDKYEVVYDKYGYPIKLRRRT